MQVLFTEDSNDIIGAFFFNCGSQAFFLEPQRYIGACFGNVRSKAKSIAQNQPERTIGIKGQINSWIRTFINW